MKKLLNETRQIEGVAESLFEKIRSRFEDVSVGDENAKATIDPAKARFFNFDFIDKAGNNFGNVTISIISEEGLKVYFGKNLSADLDEAQKADWYNFLRDLRMFAKRNLLSFDTRDISRSNLNIKDINQLSAVERPVKQEETSVTEGKIYGSTRTSYESIAPGTRLIIRHSDAVDESVRGARSRKIHAVYVEDSEGQRFKSPFTNLTGNRALARHVANGGQVYDDFGKHIVEMVEESAKIKQFIRGSRNKVYEDGEANEMVVAAKERYNTIHQILSRLKGPRGSKFYRENWNPSTTLQDDINLEELKKKFIQSNFDERLEPGLPYVQRAYNDMKKSTLESQLSEFEESMNKITEDSWALPDNDMAVQKLQELMADVLPAGMDGADATGALYDILGDDELFDKIYDASLGSPDTDVRPIIFDWLQRNMPDVFKKVKANIENGGGNEEEPDPEEEPGEVAGQEPTPEQPPEDQEQPQESASLTDIRRLAGLR